MALAAKGLVKPHSSLFALLARVVDCGIVIAAVAITAFISAGSLPQAYLIAALGAVICLQFSAEFAEIYRSWRSETIWAEARQVSACWLTSFLFILAIGSVTKLESTLFAWPQFAQWFVITLLMLLGWRVVLRVSVQKLRDKGYNTRSVAIVGNGELALDVAHRLQKCSWGGYVVRGFYDDRQAPEMPLSENQKPRTTQGMTRVCPLTGNFAELIKEARAGKIDQVYLTIPMRGEQRIQWLIEKIPLAALVGVMFMVVLGTFEWSSFRIMNKVPRTDAFVIILVSGVTVAFDLAIAVIVGVIVSALVFAWKHAQQIYADIYTDEQGRKVYDLRGPIFFGSVSNFKELFDPQNDPNEVIIEFKRSRVSDHSGIDALDALAEKYQQLGKTLHLRHLSPECRDLLNKAGDLCEINVLEDPHYHVATDKLG